MLLLFSPCFSVMLADKDTAHGSARTLWGDGSMQGWGGRAASSGLLRKEGAVSHAQLLAKQESRSQKEEFSKDYFRK